MENKELTEILKTLNIPSIPNKEWDGKKSFKDGVAEIELVNGNHTYAISTFNAEEDAKPRIKRVVSNIPFTKVLKHYPLPQYMDTDIENFDLSDEDKKKAEAIVEEAKELEHKAKKEEKAVTKGNEYYFEEIHNDEEAKAYIKFYNQKHNIKGRIPSTHETLVMRLNAIYHDKNNE